jgi:hypothetical protein
MEFVLLPNNKHGSFSRTFQHQHQWCPQKLIPVEFVLLTNNPYTRVTLCLWTNKNFVHFWFRQNLNNQIGVFELQGFTRSTDQAQCWAALWLFKNRWFWFFEKNNQNQRIISSAFFNF